MKYVKEEKNDRKISVAVLSGDNTQCYNEINHLNFLFNILKIYNFLSCCFLVGIAVIKEIFKGARRQRDQGRKNRGVDDTHTHTLSL